MPTPPDAWQRADNHDSEDEDEGDACGVGPTAHQAKQSGLAGEHPLPEGIIVFAGNRLKIEKNYLLHNSSPTDCKIYD